jgi:hypothetical protein
MNYLFISNIRREKKVKAGMKEKHKHIASCPSCNTLVMCEGEPGKKYFIKCPSCGHRGVISFNKDKKKIKNIEIIEMELDREEKENLFQQMINLFSNTQYDKILQIVGMVLIILGIILGILLIPIYIGFFAMTFLLILKLSFSLLFIGILLILMTTETRRLQRIENNKSIQNGYSQKNIEIIMPRIIAFGIIVWILVLFSLTNKTDFGIFFICVFLGILAVKELTNRFITSQLKKRTNIFIYLFLIGTLIIITQKIITQ